MTRSTALLLGLLTIGATQAPNSTVPDTLTVTIQDLRNGAGIVGAALYDEAAASTFPDGEPFRTASALSSTTGVELTFEDLPAGRYAIAVIHDENENGDLDTNEYGIPSEGFGFSNNAMGEMGPPTFERAVVTVEGSTETSISMIYMGGE